ncbi:MAG: AMP-binding protein [Clostridiales bacterium]|nr:AMP-binding protein [Clostridiales bacterium]
MREVNGTALYKAERFETIRDLIVKASEDHAELDVAIFRRKPTLPEEHRTYAQYGKAIRALSTYIINSKYKGDRLAVVGENCYEWFVSYSSILSSDSVGIPLDRALPEGELVKLLERSSAKVIFYQPKHHEMMVSIAEKMKTGEYNIAVEKFVCMYVEGISSKLVWPSDDERFVNMYDLIDEGQKLVDNGDDSFLTIPIDPEAVRIILFTSGTTSMSKGVMLTNKNICSNVFSISQTLYAARGERFFSILPLHHTFENTCDFFLMSRGCCACFSDGLRYIVKNVSEWHIDFCISVPLLFENIYDKIIEGIEQSGKKKQIDIMIPVTKFLRRFGLDLRRAVFADIIKKLGGNLRMVVIGGAGIDKRYVEFFNNIGIDFLMGYGLTETSPVIATTTLACNVYGSVGRPMVGITAAIDGADSANKIGEILTKSDCVMKGYYDNEEATKEAIDENGWFHTGDMGFIDKKGCIHVTGRVKSMIVLTNGKKAFPEEIESLLLEIPGVTEAFVWGNKNDREAIDICAKLLINRKAIAKEMGVVGEANDGDVSTYLNDKLRDANHKMPSYKIVRNYVFSEQDMIKTTTLKIKRPKEQEAIEGLLEKNNTNMRDMNGCNLDKLL